eukprot:TRINITY_DN2966_c0_g3_i1.p1 TRINITY_DN2966_c0_g3~~TRINITY_DN2966_c0_g3_i1.p1  ORF type:complete len:1469 (-),score=229.68 TRINITY_DN2966_c0_g3_i1:41-4447(-)
MRATALGVKRGSNRAKRASATLGNKGAEGRATVGDVGLQEVEFTVLLRQVTSEGELAASSLSTTSLLTEHAVSRQESNVGRGVESAGMGVFVVAETPGCCNGVLLDPSHPSKITWDVVVSAMIIYSVLVVPFRLGFGVDASEAESILDAVMDTFFAVDILLNFVTAYTDEREVLVVDYRKVSRRYLLGFFIIDVLSVFPFEPVVRAVEPAAADSASIVKLLRLVRLMKLGRLFKLRKLTDLLEAKMNLSLQMVDMVKVMFKTIFLVHLLSCCAFYVSMPICPDGSSGACPVVKDCTASNYTFNGTTVTRTSCVDQDTSWTNWVRAFGVDQLDNAARYLASFHFITATLMAVGYGDIYPSNSLERVVCLVVQLLGAVIFGVILSCITALIETSNPREVEHKKQMGEIKNWIRTRELPHGLKTRVWAHFNYLTAERSAFKEESSLLLSMPTNLRSQLVETSKSGFCQAIQSNFGQDEKNLVSELAVQVSPLYITYYTVILEMGELATEIFIVSSGRVDAMVVESHLDPERRNLEGLLQMGLTNTKTSAKPSHQHQETSSQGTSTGGVQGGAVGPSSDAGASVQFESGERRRSRSGEDHSPEGLFKHAQQRRSSALQRIAKGVGLVPPPLQKKGQGAQEGDEQSSEYVLCAIYQDMEMFGYFPISPVTYLCGSFQLELFSLSQDALDRILCQFVEKIKEFEIKAKAGCQELADAALSAEWSGGSLPQCPQVQHQRLKGLIVHKGKATDVRDLPKEVFNWSEGNLDEVIASDVKQMTKRLGMHGDVIQEVEALSDLLKRNIIAASDQRKILWDLAIGGLVIYSVLAITFRVSFSSSPGAVFVAFDIIIDIIFAADLIINFRTAFVDSDGHLNTVPCDIAWNYLRSWFMIDFLSTAPIDRIVEAVVADNSNGQTRMLKLARFARLFRLMKLARMLKLFKLIELAESSVEVSPVLIKFLVLALNVAFLGHMIACIWHWVVTFQPYTADCESGMLGCSPGESPPNPPTTWLEAMATNSPVDADVVTEMQKYAASLYWVFTTMTTVGYGDITPTNNVERAVAVFVMIFGAAVFGYIVGSVAEMASNTQHNLAMESMIMLRYYCEEQNLPQSIMHSVRQHYEFWYQENSPYHYEAELLQKMPPPLRKEVILHIHKHVITGISLFERPLPNWLHATLVRMLEPQAYSPGELILHPKEARMPQDIYFVYEGECEAYLHTPGSSVTVAHPSRISRTENQRDGGSRVSQAPSEKEEPLEVYGPGSLVGIEQLLGEEALQAFGVPVQFCVRASLAGSCWTFSLRVVVLVDAARANPHMGSMLKEIMSETIIQEGKRRIKARQAAGNEFYKKVESAAQSQPSVVSPSGPTGPRQAGQAVASPPSVLPDVPDAHMRLISVDELENASGPAPNLEPAIVQPPLWITPTPLPEGAPPETVIQHLETLVEESNPEAARGRGEDGGGTGGGTGEGGPGGTASSIIDIG